MSIPTLRGLNPDKLLISKFALLDYRVTKRDNLSVAQNKTVPSSEIKWCLIIQSDLPRLKLLVFRVLAR